MKNKMFWENILVKGIPVNINNKKMILKSNVL